jgi:hypothetical protein
MVKNRLTDYPQTLSYHIHLPPSTSFNYKQIIHPSLLHLLGTRGGSRLFNCLIRNRIETPGYSTNLRQATARDLTPSRIAKASVYRLKVLLTNEVSC